MHFSSSSTVAECSLQMSTDKENQQNSEIPMSPLTNALNEASMSSGSPVQKPAITEAKEGDDLAKKTQKVCSDSTHTTTQR